MINSQQSELKCAFFLNSTEFGNLDDSVELNGAQFNVDHTKMHVELTNDQQSSVEINRGAAKMSIELLC